MVQELYTTFAIFVSSGLLLALGLMLLLTAIPDSPLLGNYRKARYMMAAAYLFFACMSFCEYLFGGSEPDIPLMRTITIAVSASQAFIFTLATLALHEIRFPGWRSIFREAIPAMLLIFAVFTVYAFCSEACFDVAVWVFTGMYALLLMRYISLFVRNYRRFRLRMDNYYSEAEAARTRWVIFSFFAALPIGVGALLTMVFMSTAVMLVFTVMFDVFYTYFAIRLINYTDRFHIIEAAMENAAPENPDRHQAGNALPTAIAGAIETGLKDWIDEKLFLRPGVTLSDVARHVGTNNKYLSLYINRHLGRTFREWIVEQRIEEAKRLMLEDPDTTLAEIASRTGFATKSHFGQQFRHFTGFSPSDWRRQASRSR